MGDAPLHPTGAKGVVRDWGLNKGTTTGVCMGIL